MSIHELRPPIPITLTGASWTLRFGDVVMSTQERFCKVVATPSAIDNSIVTVFNGTLLVYLLAIVLTHLKINVGMDGTGSPCCELQVLFQCCILADRLVTGAAVYLMCVFLLLSN